MFEEHWCDKCQKVTDHFKHGVEYEVKNGETLFQHTHLTCRCCKTSILETMVYKLQYEYTMCGEV